MNYKSNVASNCESLHSHIVLLSFSIPCDHYNDHREKVNNYHGRLVRQMKMQASFNIFKIHIRFICTYVTGYWKTDHKVTLGQLHFIGPANSHTHALLHYWAKLTSLLSRDAFADRVKSRQTMGPMEGTRWEVWV